MNLLCISHLNIAEMKCTSKICIHLFQWHWCEQLTLSMVSTISNVNSAMWPNYNKVVDNFVWWQIRWCFIWCKCSITVAVLFKVKHWLLSTNLLYHCHHHHHHLEKQNIKQSKHTYIALYTNYNLPSIQHLYHAAVMLGLWIFI